MKMHSSDYINPEEEESILTLQTELNIPKEVFGLWKKSTLNQKFKC